jgi:uncharacterized protein with PIN domain
MIVDSSAVIAILRDEPEAPSFANAIAAAASSLGNSKTRDGRCPYQNHGKLRGLSTLALPAYALAKSARESLLFEGEDFTHTDLSSAL